MAYYTKPSRANTRHDRLVFAHYRAVFERGRESLAIQTLREWRAKADRLQPNCPTVAIDLIARVSELIGEYRQSGRLVLDQGHIAELGRIVARCEPMGVCRD